MDYISEAVEELSGYTPADFIERRVTFADLIHPADRAQVSRNILYAVANNEPFDIEYRIYHADGTRRWVLEHGRPVYGEDGLVRTSTASSSTSRARGWRKRRSAPARSGFATSPSTRPT
ncbi:MAG: PAS domain-containing protein [Armatimonadetes bacterium]|nr:PAS domain-containing protein [Armatimonadota bacterium]